MAFNTVSGAIERLIQVGILHQASTTRPNRTFAYPDYLAILREGRNATSLVRCAFERLSSICSIKGDTVSAMVF
jgi:hypothetical protein